MEAALLEICVNSSLRARLGAAARGTIDTKSLTWDSNAARVVEIARAAITARRGAAPRPARGQAPGP
jgi:hypothetical protein